MVNIFSLKGDIRTKAIVLARLKYEYMSNEDYITDEEFFEFVATKLDNTEKISIFSRAWGINASMRNINAFFKAIGLTVCTPTSEKQVIIADKYECDEARKAFNKNVRLHNEIKQRDNHRCQKCGIHEKYSTLHIHHIEPIYRHPEKAQNHENLITFCEGCHVQFHVIFGHGRTTSFGHEELAEFLDMHLEDERYNSAREFTVMCM